jgi:hypothetical protein
MGTSSRRHQAPSCRPYQALHCRRREAPYWCHQAINSTFGERGHHGGDPRRGGKVL